MDQTANAAVLALFETLNEKLSQGDNTDMAAAFQARLVQAVHLLDRAAEAELANGEVDLASRMVRLCRALMPDSVHYVRRDINVSLRAGDDTIVPDLLAHESSLRSCQDAAWAIETLCAFGRAEIVLDLAERMVARHGISSTLLVVARARQLIAAGHLYAAAEAVRQGLAESAEDKSAEDVILLRLGSDLWERMGNLEDAADWRGRAALAAGAAGDLRTAARLWLSLFDFAALERLLTEFGQRYPDQQPVAGQLDADLQRRQEEAARALVAGGPIDGAGLPEIMARLTDTDMPPALIVWGKMALVAWLRTEPISLAQFWDVSSRLANWEGPLVRQMAGFKAERYLGQDAAFLTERLRFLAGSGHYGDAAARALLLAEQGFGTEAVFVCVMLLRVHQAGLAPPFMSAEEAGRLRDTLRQGLDTTDPAVVSVLHDHLAAIGIDPGPWPAWQTGDPRQASGFRNLFAWSSGRLERRSRRASPPPAREPNPIVVITGQLRGFEGAWPAMLRYLIEPTGAPVVMSVWDRTSNAKGRHAARLDRVLPASVLTKLRPEERFTDIFEQNYPRTAQMLFGETPVDVDELVATMRSSGPRYLDIETESDARLHANLPDSLNRNMINMYYKLHRGEQLVTLAEQRTGVSFSHVIWIRPDCQVLNLSGAVLRDSLRHQDVGFSSWSDLGNFGDYLMILPRLAFAAVGSVIQRVGTAGNSLLFPWRAARIDNPGQVVTLAGLAGPATLFDVLLSAGCLPLGRLPRLRLRLLGRTPRQAAIEASFAAEAHALAEANGAI